MKDRIAGNLSVAKSSMARRSAPSQQIRGGFRRNKSKVGDPVDTAKSFSERTNWKKTKLAPK
jgi:hypothetical protein